MADKSTIAGIIALLLSLAGMAERASRASFATRCLLLFILRRAERSARSCAGNIGISLNAPQGPGWGEARRSPAYAAWLALRLRAVALALQVHIAPGAKPAPTGMAQHGDPLRASPAGEGLDGIGLASGRAAARLDTS